VDVCGVLQVSLKRTSQRARRKTKKDFHETMNGAKHKVSRIKLREWEMNMKTECPAQSTFLRNNCSLSAHLACEIGVRSSLPKADQRWEAMVSRLILIRRMKMPPGREERSLIHQEEAVF
jgi:hypothetical protein